MAHGLSHVRTDSCVDRGDERSSCANIDRRVYSDANILPRRHYILNVGGVGAHRAVERRRFLFVTFKIARQVEHVASQIRNNFVELLSLTTDRATA